MDRGQRLKQRKQQHAKKGGMKDKDFRMFKIEGWVKFL
jgi:hypothetical protein